MIVAALGLWQNSRLLLILFLFGLLRFLVCYFFLFLSLGGRGTSRSTFLPSFFALRVREAVADAIVADEQAHQSNFSSEWRGPMCLKPALDLLSPKSSSWTSHCRKCLRGRIL